MQQGKTGPLIVTPNEHDELVDEACGVPSIKTAERELDRGMAWLAVECAVLPKVGHLSRRGSRESGKQGEHDLDSRGYARINHGERNPIYTLAKHDKT